VIVVNDGSSDGTDTVVKKYVEEHSDKNLVYIDFPRVESREMGDNQFRAGISRNLGARQALGEYLVFLDADILVPNNFFQKLNEEIKDHRVIQFHRHFLKKEVSHTNTVYKDINLAKDTFVPEGGYWKKFFESKTPWMNVQFPWKYVCTYGLVMGRKLFNEVGGFRRNYTSYGFEDTDLGFRLYQCGVEFFKSKIETLHLNHSHFRSEYKNSFFKRLKLLKRTARIFYFNNLDSHTFEALGGLVDDRILLLKLRDWLKNFMRKYKIIS
jgi:glycosyltransferase involved in cell wall biosynthesis